MKKLLKPANIGFYLLMLLTCFILGLYFAGAIDAGKNQGLAGGAIVVGYGVLFAGVGFVASFFIAYYIATKVIVKLNIFLLLILLAGIGYKYFEFQQRDRIQKEESEKFKPPSTTPTSQTKPLGMVMKFNSKSKISQKYLNEENNEMGMGFFSPNFYENQTLYFYSNLNLEKELMDHPPYDSITFKRNKYNQFDIATAPPFLVPEYLKLDYDRLYFKVVSVTEDFVEIIVNKTNGQTSYVNRRAGQLIYWPEFLLSMHSVEFLPNTKEKVHARSFETSGEVNTPHQFMKAIQIKGDWMKVLLLNSDFKTVGKGWIHWKHNEKIFIKYNLLS